ncbi:AAA family ATPase [Actinoplanes sp. URMC 104]|uniref:ATP-binding protein n=1 Tax=Actinoplanes sp. URMC 104 TaxID=3423409 RepID=UPI003F1B688F
MAEFVGRRAELRELLGAACRAGLVVHGAGGIGKSRLVAELLRRLEPDQPGGRTVRVPGSATVDDVMIALGEPRPITEPVTLVVDDFATVPRPGGGGRAEPVDPALAGFLAGWVREPGPRRLVVTSRYPFALPGNAHRRLAELHLGPLTSGDGRRLASLLPGLAALPPGQQDRAWAFCGGHPRALEDLDTLLRQGGADFADVAGRIEDVLAANGIGDPLRWAGFDDPTAGRALAGAIATIVDEVLVHDLLEVRHHAARAGDLAGRLGDDEEAAAHHRRALAVDERLGRRAGPAGRHRLGLLPGDDDPAEAERHLRQALAVDAESGNRAGMASGLHRLGLVCTLTGRLPAAVALHCRAFATELALGSPDAPIELADLSRLRAELGDEAFRRAATEVLPEASMNGLIRMLDDFVTAADHRYN